MDRGGREVRVHRGHTTSVRQRVALNPEDAVHLVAHREVRVTRLDDASDASGTHHFADLDRRHVRPTGVHPGAHRRIDGQVLHPHEEFTVGRTRHRLLGERPVGRLG